MLSGWLDWLNCNSGAVEAIAIVVLVLVTMVHVRRTGQIVAESKKFREVTTRPKVIVTLAADKYYFNLVNLRVENIGGGAARNIRLSTNSEFRTMRGTLLRDLGLFKNGLSLLGPGREIETRLENVTGWNNDRDRFQTSFTITASYTNAAGRSFEEDFLIDFSFFEELSQIFGDPLRNIAESLKTIAERSYDPEKG